MVRSDSIAVRKSTDASLSQQFTALQIFVSATRVAMQQTRVNRSTDAKRWKSERTIQERNAHQRR